MGSTTWFLIMVIIVMHLYHTFKRWHDRYCLLCWINELKKQLRELRPVKKYLNKRIYGNK